MKNNSRPSKLPLNIIFYTFTLFRSSTNLYSKKKRALITKIDFEKQLCLLLVDNNLKHQLRFFILFLFENFNRDYIK